MKKIVLYNVSEDIVDRYKNIKEFNDIVFSRIFDEDLETIINDLFKLEDHNGTNLKFEKSYMLMEGISPDDLTYINKVLKENDLSFKGIKVMKTDHNKEWTLKALLDEVTEEDEVMSRVTILRKLIISTNDLDLNKYDEDLSFGLKQALMNGYVLIKSKDLQIDKLDEAIRNIQYFLNAIEKA